MSKENYLAKIKDLPEFTKQFGGLVIIILIVILLSFTLFQIHVKFTKINFTNYVKIISYII